MCIKLDGNLNFFLNQRLYFIPQITTKTSKVFPKDIEAPPGGVDDMTKLSYLHEPGVLQNLATRYDLNEIYVRFMVNITTGYVLSSSSKIYKISSVDI